MWVYTIPMTDLYLGMLIYAVFGMSIFGTIACMNKSMTETGYYTWATIGFVSFAIVYYIRFSNTVSTSRTI